MKLQTAQTWDEMFFRIMQSWLDTSRYLAPLENPYETDFEDCEECQRHDLALFAARQDTTVEKWPHWMVEHLADLLLQLRLEIQERTLERPLADGVVRDYFIGSGTIPSRHRDAATKEALEAMSLVTQTYYLWIQGRLSDLGEWPRWVYEALKLLDSPGNPKPDGRARVRGFGGVLGLIGDSVVSNERDCSKDGNDYENDE